MRKGLNEVGVAEWSVSPACWLFTPTWGRKQPPGERTGPASFQLNAMSSVVHQLHCESVTASFRLAPGARIGQVTVGVRVLVPNEENLEAEVISAPVTEQLSVSHFVLLRTRPQRAQLPQAVEFIAVSTPASI